MVLLLVSLNWVVIVLFSGVKAIDVAEFKEVAVAILALGVVLDDNGFIIFTSPWFCMSS